MGYGRAHVSSAPGSQPATPLAGHVALVTGAARGIGASIARRLSEGGAAVMVGDLDEAPSAALAAELDGPAAGVAMDVTELDSFSAAADGDRRALREPHVAREQRRRDASRASSTA